MHPAAAPDPPLASIFISSTCRDMEAYRRAVEDALIHKAQVGCFLSEEWTGGYDDVVQKCKDRVHGSSGFLLLLGFFYGWIPGDNKSITQMEFEWAFGKWKHLPYPPMAVFAPEHNSEADLELRSEALKYIPRDPGAKKEHDDRLNAFRAKVLGAGRSAQFFANRQELREHAIVACLLWTRQTPLSAALSKNASNAESVTDEKLGSLGRKRQLDAVSLIVSEINADPGEPACAALVYGDDDAGQRVFLTHVAQTQDLARCRPAHIGRPPSPQYDVNVLSQWVASSLGLPNPTEIDDVSKLAAAIGGELRNQPLFFMLDHVHRLTGGLRAFISQFWQPLRQQLRIIHSQRALENRLIAFAAHYSSLDGCEQFVCEVNASQFDYSRILALPRLTEISEADVRLWLNQLDVPFRSADQRSKIVSLVLRNAVDEFEGKPLRVYERLRSIDFSGDRGNIYE